MYVCMYIYIYIYSSSAGLLRHLIMLEHIYIHPVATDNVQGLQYRT